jgi:hypothetical protein
MNPRTPFSKAEVYEHHTYCPGHLSSSEENMFKIREEETATEKGDGC